MRAPGELHVLEPLDRRIPDWDMRRLVRRRCPFCSGAGHPRFIRPDALRVNYCERCGAYFVSPAPDKHRLDDFYASYFSRHRKEELWIHRRDRLLVREMFDLDPFHDEKAAILGSLISLNGKRVLDVGFGLGQNILLLQKLGGIVSGIDTDPDAVAFAQDILHLKQVQRCTLEDLPLRERFHLITLHDLVEHPLRPLVLLRQAVRHLEPGGFLSIWTPNATDAEADPSPVQFRADLEHMQYLTVRTAAFIASLLSMDIVHLACTGTPRLEQIATLAGTPSASQRARKLLRRLVSPLPGAATLAGLRRTIGSPRRRRGTYHLFLILRKSTTVGAGRPR